MPLTVKTYTNQAWHHFGDKTISLKHVKGWEDPQSHFREKDKKHQTGRQADGMTDDGMTDKLKGVNPKRRIIDKWHMLQIDQRALARIIYIENKTKTQQTQGDKSAKDS